MKIRTEVLSFAEEMERVLRKNDWKDGWHHEHFNCLLDCIKEEVLELRQAMITILKAERDSDEAAVKKEKIEIAQKECIDIANFAMMIHDNLEAIKELK